MKISWKNILYGNYFYGICAVALSIEATLQQNIPFLNPLYYLILFFGTVYYYSKAYTHLNDATSSNPRIKWYHQNAKSISLRQNLMLGLIIILCILYIYSLYPLLTSYPDSYRDSYLISHISLLIVYPLAGLLYYQNLRSIGWLKPILIGFTWAGIVTVYPLVFASIEHHQELKISLINILLFIKNMMFVLVLCVLFDIKDYAADYNKSVKTFVVKYGLRKTIFYICIPLSVLGLGTFITYGLTHNFSAMKLVLNAIPFLFLFIVAYSLKSRRSIIYYLFIIDGMMLLKAICGSIAMYYF